MRSRATLGLVALFGTAFSLTAASPPYKTQNVVVIVTDGLRWQEVFRGAETTLVSSKPGGVEDEAATKRTFWRATEAEKRAGAASLPLDRGRQGGPDLRQPRRRLDGAGRATATSSAIPGTTRSSPARRTRASTRTSSGRTRTSRSSSGSTPLPSCRRSASSRAGTSSRTFSTGTAASWTCASAGRRRTRQPPEPARSWSTSSTVRSPTSSWTCPGTACCRRRSSATSRPGSRGCSSWATARPTSGRTTAATTSSCPRRTTWTATSASCGPRCRRCPNTRTRRPS